MKKKLLIILGCLLLAASLVLTGCGGTKGEETETTKAPEPVQTECSHGEIEWVIDRAATCTEEGLRHSECADCGTRMEIGDVIPAKGHSFADGVCSGCGGVLISDAAGLTALATAVNGGESYEGKWVVLGADIDLGGKEWTPIGINLNVPFMGSFDGAGHVVSNFTITSTEVVYAGLFGSCKGGELRNVGVEGFSINIHDSSEALFGGLGSAGGLVGYNSGKVTHCYAKGTISVSRYSSFEVGGLVGESYPASAVIQESYAAVNVTAVGTLGATGGGLVGDSRGAIYNCYATGDVSVTNNSMHSVGSVVAGGLAGMGGSEARISQCYATGNVEARGGSSSYSCLAGGLIGSAGNEVLYCFATGNVSQSGGENAGAGGLFGRGESSSTNYHSAEQQIEGGIKNAVGEIQAAAVMQTASFVIGTMQWDAKIWNAIDGQYPTLK
ncbi:MAG: hypothetical protein E7668_06955 [Ruminococcaceae bacterium]|nr:hypothetical protein [Oscillospiraceae bacterium]